MDQPTEPPDKANQARASEPVRQHFGWTDTALDEARIALECICEQCLHESFLDPVLARVWESEGGTVAWVAERIGVNKSTTSRWPWPNRPRATTDQDRRHVPNLRQYFLLLAAYGIDPEDLLLPHGRDVAIEVWRRCIGYADREWLGGRVGREIEDAELFCLHLRQAAFGHRSGNLPPEDLRELVAAVIRHCGPRALRGPEQVAEVVQRWSLHYDLVATLIPLGWEVE
jgi:hypothetical protein